MRNVSAEFLAEVRRSHTVVSEVWCYPADGSDAVQVPVSDGSVTLDATQPVRARLDISVEDTDWIPTDASDSLAPFGSELVAYRGVRYADGTTELVTLGWFGLEDAEITDDGTGATARVAALDRMDRLSKAKFEDTYQVANGTLYTQAIVDVVDMLWPDCDVMDNFVGQSAMTSTLRPTAQLGDDPVEFIQGLAYAIGMSLFFDGDGKLTLRKFTAQSPVLEVSEGDVLLTTSRSWSRTAAFNKVIVTGENTDGADVFRGEAFDSNPESPTYFYGPFGRVTEVRSFSQVESDNQAADVAANILAQEIGVPSAVQFTMVPCPALEVEDTVRVSRPSVGVDDDFVLDQLTIGLGASEVMSGVCRERRVF